MTPDEYLERFRARVLQDALAEALPVYWERRAQQFEWAISTADDRVVDQDDQEQRDRNLRDLADECRRRAATRRGLDSDWWDSLVKGVLGDSQPGA